MLSEITFPNVNFNEDNLLKNEADLNRKRKLKDCLVLILTIFL